jgi:hypothetical protein
VGDKTSRVFLDNLPSSPAHALVGKRLCRDLARDDRVDLVAGQDAALDERFDQGMDNFNVARIDAAASASQYAIRAATDAATATLANALASI